MHHIVMSRLEQLVVGTGLAVALIVNGLMLTLISLYSSELAPGRATV